MSGDEPEVPLTRAGVVLVLGGILAGLSQSEWVQPGGALSDTFLVGGVFLVAGGAVATVRVLHAHRKDRR